MKAIRVWNDKNTADKTHNIGVSIVQILEAADRIQALDMKKRALDIIVANFPKVWHSGYLSCVVILAFCGIKNTVT